MNESEADALFAKIAQETILLTRKMAGYEARIAAIKAEAEKDTSAKIEAINKDIEDFQKELNDIVENTKGDTVVLGAEFLQKKKDLEQKIREKQTELRRVQMAKLQGIDALGQKLENLNTLAVPLFILVVAVILGIRRSARKRHYISHTSDS